MLARSNSRFVQGEGVIVAREHRHAPSWRLPPPLLPPSALRGTPHKVGPYACTTTSLRKQWPVLSAIYSIMSVYLQAKMRKKEARQL